MSVDAMEEVDVLVVIKGVHFVSKEIDHSHVFNAFSRKEKLAKLGVSQARRRTFFVEFFILADRTLDFIGRGVRSDAQFHEDVLVGKDGRNVDEGDDQKSEQHDEVLGDLVALFEGISVRDEDDGRDGDQVGRKSRE